MTTKHTIYFLIGLKVICGLALLALGIHTGEQGTMIAGAGHAFILAPLWYWTMGEG